MKNLVFLSWEFHTSLFSLISFFLSSSCFPASVVGTFQRGFLRRRSDGIFLSLSRSNLANVQERKRKGGKCQKIDNFPSHLSLFSSDFFLFFFFSDILHLSLVCLIASNILPTITKQIICWIFPLLARTCSRKLLFLLRRQES